MKYNFNELRKNEALGILVNIGVCISFLIISVVLSIYFSRSGLLILRSDSSFHLSRAEEIYRNLKDGSLFTFIATHTFHQTGVGNFIFYPTIFIYPLAIFRFFANPITAYYMWYGMFMLLTFIIAYYSMISFSNGNKVRSYIFSLVYTISSYHLYLGIINLVLGEFQAFTFLPIVFLAGYKILYQNKYRYWIWLSFGMAAIIYCHFISTYLTVLFIAIILIIKLNSNLIDKKQIFSFIKAVITTILLTAPILFQLINELYRNNIKSPEFGFKFLVSPNDMVVRGINNDSINQNLGIVLVITMLVGWYFVRKNKRERVIYALGILTFACTTTLFPWEDLQYTKLVHILGEMQFPFRLLAYATLFLAVTSSYIISRIINASGKKNSLFLFICALLIVNYFGMVSQNSVAMRNPNSNLLTKVNSSTTPLSSGSIVNKDNYNSIFEYSVLYGERDYYHKKSFEGNKIDTILTNKMYLNNHEVDHEIISVKANEIIYSLNAKKSGYLDLPTIVYKGTKVFVNGKEVTIKQSDRGTVSINIEKGKNMIDIKYVPSKVYYYLIGLSVITWVFIIVIVLLKFK